MTKTKLLNVNPRKQIIFQRVAVRLTAKFSITTMVTRHSKMMPVDTLSKNIF